MRKYKHAIHSGQNAMEKKGMKRGYQIMTEKIGALWTAFVLLVSVLAFPLGSAADSAAPDADYSRAFAEGYVDAAWQEEARDRQVLTGEFRGMLVSMISRLAPDRLEWFEQKVTEFSAPMVRGQGVVMAWYAAVCIGADGYTDTGRNFSEDDPDFWNTGDAPLEELFPDVFQPNPVETEMNIWDNEFIASFLWNQWHTSPVSGQMAFAWDEENKSMHHTDPCTLEEAICAVTRLWDSMQNPGISAGQAEPAEAAMPAEPDPIQEYEMNLAGTIGFPQEADGDGLVSGAELAEILDAFIRYACPDKAAEWQETSSLLRLNPAPLAKADMLAFLFLAARTAGRQYTDHQGAAWEMGSTAFPLGNDLQADLYPESILADESLYCGDAGQGPLQQAAWYLNLGRYSCVSGEHLLSIPKISEMAFVDLQERASYADAVTAALRLVSSADPELFEPYGGATPIHVAAEERIQAYRKTATEPQITGNTWYISENGDDRNDGRTPETAIRSIERIPELDLKPGDGILFERGGMWYIPYRDPQFSFTIGEGVFAGAYGEGDKPILRGDIPEANDPSFWEPVVDEEGIRIWKAAQDCRSCSVVVFNGGEKTAVAILPWFSPEKEPIHPDGSPFIAVESLSSDLSFCCLPDKGMDANWREDTGHLYLRCDAGNPAEVFQDIAIPQAGSVSVLNHGTAADLDIRYFNVLGIGSTSDKPETEGQRFINLEISWCGGSIGEARTVYSGEELIGYYPGTGGTGILVFGRDASIENCVIRQCGLFGICAPVHRYFSTPGEERMENILIRGNVIEDCPTYFHTAGYAEMDVPGSHSYAANVVFEENILVNNGKCWMNRMRDGIGGTLPMVEDQHGGMDNDGIYIRNNMIYNHGIFPTFGESLYKWDGESTPNRPMEFSSNQVIQAEALPLYQTVDHGQYRNWYASEESMRDMMHDESGTVETIMIPQS